MGAADDAGEELRIFHVHRTISQGTTVPHPEIGSPFSDDGGVKGLIKEGGKYHPGSQFVLEGPGCGCYEHPGLHVIVPVLFGQSRQGLTGQDVVAEFIDVPGKDRLAHRTKGGHRIIPGFPFQCKGNPLLDLEVIEDEVFILFQGWCKCDKRIAAGFLQVGLRFLLIAECIVPVAEAVVSIGSPEFTVFAYNITQKSRKSVFFRILISLGQRRQGIHKKTIIPHTLLRCRCLYLRADTPQHLTVSETEEIIGIAVITHMKFLLSKNVRNLFRNKRREPLPPACEICFAPAVRFKGNPDSITGPLKGSGTFESGFSQEFPFREWPN